MINQSNQNLVIIISKRKDTDTNLHLAEAIQVILVMIIRIIIPLVTQIFIRKRKTLITTIKLSRPQTMTRVSVKILHERLIKYQKRQIHLHIKLLEIC